MLLFRWTYQKISSKSSVTFKSIMSFLDIYKMDLDLMSTRCLFVFKPTGVRQGSPGRRLCFRVCRVRSVNQTPPSPPSQCLQTMREVVGLTLLTATSSHSSSSAPSWSGLGQNNIVLIYMSLFLLFGSLLFFCMFFFRCSICLWLSSWITLSTWHEIHQSWVPITWTSLFASGGSMIVWHGETRCYYCCIFLFSFCLKLTWSTFMFYLYPAEGRQRVWNVITFFSVMSCHI